MSNDFWSTLNKKKREELLGTTQTKETSKASEELKSGDFWSSLNPQKRKELLESATKSGGTSSTRTFSNDDDDDIAPVMSTVETTQEIFDKYGHYYNSSDYEKYSKQGATIENPTMKEAQGWMSFGDFHLGGKKVGNIVTYSRDNANEIAMGELNLSNMVGKSKYRHMTDFEVGIYNYLLAKEGEDAAKEYLDDIEETLNAREGGAMAEAIQNTSGVTSAILHGVVSVGSGIESAGIGIRQLFSEEALPMTSTEFS